MSRTGLRLGLVINPYAGIGGAVGLKGSDGESVRQQAFERGAVPHATERVADVLCQLQDCAADWQLLVCPGDMGEQAARQAGCDFTVLTDLSPTEPSTAEDTQQAVRQLQQAGVDVLLFAGGDGTARDICDVVNPQQLVLGIPAGVKIHSGVYATSTRGAAEILRKLVQAQAVAVGMGEVRDIDEEAFRHGSVQARYYGEMLVPQEHQFLQQVKCGGRLPDAVALDDLAAGVEQLLEDDAFYLIGPGSTTRAIMDHLGLPSTLLGVDLIRGRELVGLDLTEQALLDALDSAATAYIVLTPIGGQGHILGRGNHQFGPALLRRIGIENLLIVATPAKLQELGDRPLRVDTYDPDLNRDLCGLRRVITGYESQVVCRVVW